MKNLGTVILVVMTWLTLNIDYVDAKEVLKIVKTENVCMITNVVFPNRQIPVHSQGKIYYGCCENCKKTLTEDTTSHYSTDPVSGKSVDKAKAVIAARTDGSVIYFENANNVRKYSK